MPVKGALEFKRFKEGKPLTRKGAILAQCYECNGYEAQDCLGTSCPLYEYHPWRKVSNVPLLPRRFMSLKNKEKLHQGRIRANFEKESLKGIELPK